MPKAIKINELIAAIPDMIRIIRSEIAPEIANDVIGNWHYCTCGEIYEAESPGNVGDQCEKCYNGG